MTDSRRFNDHQAIGGGDLDSEDLDHALKPPARVPVTQSEEDDTAAGCPLLENELGEVLVGGHEDALLLPSQLQDSRVAEARPRFGHGLDVVAEEEKTGDQPPLETLVSEELAPVRLQPARAEGSNDRAYAMDASTSARVKRG